MDLAIRVDTWLQHRELHTQHRELHTRHLTMQGFLSSSPLETTSPTLEPEPMQMGRFRLSVEERRRRQSEGLCMYCGVAGHFVASCLAKSKNPSVGKSLLAGEVILNKPSATTTMLSVKLCLNSNRHECQALIDSGAEGNFIDSKLA